MAGILYTVATPIGNLQDITLRAITTLKAVDVIAAEDTRHSGTLLQAHGIQTPMISMHEHNERQRAEALVTRLLQGEKVALICDAGTPLISDPGCHFIQLALAKGIQVSPVPGPCALIAALSASGMSAREFVFRGFLPPKSADRQKALTQLQRETKTLVFYEAPHRIVASLEAMQETFGGNRRALVARELTKRFETLHGETLEALVAWINATPQQQKGEFVIVVEGEVQAPQVELDDTVQSTLKILMSELPMTQAVKLTAKLTNTKKNQVYAVALAMKKS